MAQTTFETGMVISSEFLNDIQTTNHIYHTSNSIERTLAEKIEESRTPLDFGAVGDGVTNDLAAIKAALESGYIIDGLGLTYAINGTCAPTSINEFHNATLFQIGDNSTTNIQTLKLVDLSNFNLNNITINMGTNVTTLFTDDANSGLYVGGSNYLTRITNFTLTNIKVTGNGCGTGIQIRHADKFIVDTCKVYDRISGSSPDPNNDSQNGFEFVNCNKFVVSNCLVSNLKTRISSVDTIIYSRGFLFSEVVDVSITGCLVNEADQGFDFSGGYVPAENYYGNRQFTISGCVADSCNTFGFKFANITHNGLVSSCIANNIGSIGFVFSAASYVSGIDNYLTSNIDVVGCKVVNALGTGSSGTNATGFRIMAGSGGSATYPRGIRFKSCSVQDNQTTPTTTGGFISDVALPEYNTTGYNKSIENITLSCTIGDNITTPYTGINPPLCFVTGTSTQAVSSVTWTELNWNFDISDTSYLHSITSNTQNIYIKTTGWYEIRAQIQFDVNSTGFRSIRFKKNGSIVDRSTVMSPAVSGTGTVVASTVPIFLVSGDRVSVESYQNSGGSLNVNLNESSFNLTWIG